jgi:predicted permease
VLQDLRFGLKLLWKEKAFSITALLTLALCIGANTAIFTVLHTVVLDPLPYPDSGRLVTMYNIYPGIGVTDRGANAVPDYLDRKQLTDIFDSVTLVGLSGFDMGAQGSPQRVDGQVVTPSYFRVLRSQPMLGRAFTEDDAVIGKEQVTILSYGLWKDVFSGDRKVLGQEVRLSGRPYRVVGVMPEGFGAAGRETKIWVPFAFTPRQMSDDERHSNNYGMIGRLKPGVTLVRTQKRIDALNRANIERAPQYRKLLEDARFGTVVRGLKDEMVRDIRPTLYLLQAAVAFVLLIGCVNVANLMLVRSNLRMKELAVRHSLGAGQWRLARQLLTESVTLAVLGGALGVFAAWGGTRLLVWLGARDLPRGASIHVDATVLAFNAAVAILTGLVFGSVPVYHLFRRNLNDVFRETSRTGTAERRAVWTRSALVVCQVSLAFVLLIGAGLLTLSFVRVLAVDPGFKPEHVLAAQFSLPQVRYDDARARAFVDRLMENVRALPGAAHAGVTTYLPFGGSINASVISIVGRPLTPGTLPPVPGWNIVDAGYFRTMEIPLLAGRGFTESDGPNSQRVVVIDRLLARKYWPKGDALGAQIRRGVDNDDAPWTIVGIVGSVKTGDLAEQNPMGQIYYDYRQFPQRTMHVVLKSATDGGGLTSALRGEIVRADPELPLFDIKTMPDRVSASLMSRRAAMILCLVFAGLALLLSAVGIYGVLAYAVTQRTREFGIRVALGAAARDILGMVVGQGLRLAAAGLCIGIAGALLLTRWMTGMLYAVRPGEPGVFVLMAATLAIVAVIASLLPSLRALRIRPANALRYE